MSKDQTFEELWAEAVKKIPPFEWDDPKQSDDARWEEYEKRFDRIILPPPYPDDPKEVNHIYHSLETNHTTILHTPQHK